jgi:uncharacterized membrane protein
MSEVEKKTEVVSEKKTETVSNQEPLNTNLVIMWGLFWIGLFTAGVTSIVAVIWAHVARGENRTDMENSHFTYAIRTFWWAFLWSFISLLTYLFGVGIIIGVIVGFWYIYRVVVGTIKVLDKKSVG